MLDNGWILGRVLGIYYFLENQFGFMPGSLDLEATFFLRQLIEKFREERNFYMFLLVLET